MERFRINDKVVYKDQEHKIVSVKKDYGSKAILYKVNGLDEWIPDKSLSPLFVEKKIEKKPINKQAEFAKKLIATEK